MYDIKLASSLVPLALILYVLASALHRCRRTNLKVIVAREKRLTITTEERKEKPNHEMYKS